MNTARILPHRRGLLLCASILLLFVSATTRDFGTTPLVARSFGPIAAALVEPSWKLLLWILPALYIVRCQTRNIFGYLKLGNMRQGILWGLAGSFFFFLRLLVHVLAGRAFHLVHSFDTWLNVAILVGFVEETMFRGFLFQEFKTWWMRSPRKLALPLSGKEGMRPEEEEEGIDLSQWIPTWSTFWAATVSTLLFVLIHFPAWIMQHQPLDPIIETSLFHLFFGYALCAVFVRSQSLWSCIIMHTMNNLSLLLIL